MRSHNSISTLRCINCRHRYEKDCLQMKQCLKCYKNNASKIKCRNVWQHNAPEFTSDPSYIQAQHEVIASKRDICSACQRAKKSKTFCALAEHVIQQRLTLPESTRRIRRRRSDSAASLASIGLQNLEELAVWRDARALCDQKNGMLDFIVLNVDEDPSDETSFAAQAKEFYRECQSVLCPSKKKKSTSEKPSPVPYRLPFAPSYSLEELFESADAAGDPLDIKSKANPRNKKRIIPQRIESPEE